MWCIIKYFARKSVRKTKKRNKIVTLVSLSVKGQRPVSKATVPFSLRVWHCTLRYIYVHGHVLNDHDIIYYISNTSRNSVLRTILILWSTCYFLSSLFLLHFIVLNSFWAYNPGSFMYLYTIYPVDPQKPKHLTLFGANLLKPLQFETLFFDPPPTHHESRIRT